MRGDVVVSFALLVGLSSSSAGQEIVSASSGVLQYFEGAVFLDDKPVEHKAAVFPSLRNGSILRTAKGRAELLLTPGVYLRMDEDSGFRMKSNALVDTQVELTSGRAILDNLNADNLNGVALVFKDSTIRFPKPGVYRIDSELAELEPYNGEAEVMHRDFTTKTVSTVVDSSHIYYFSLGMTTTKFGEGATDEFYDWAHNRSEVIANQNQMAAAQQQEADDPDPGGGVLALPSPLSPVNSGGPWISGTGSLYGSIEPLYLNPQPPLFGLFPSPLAIFVLAPTRHWPVGTKWPPPPVWGYHPRPQPTHWAVPTQIGSAYGSGTTLRFPARPIYGSSPVTARPTGTFVPRPAAPSGAMHGVAPHVGVPHVAIGHR
jgi:hypothetical protein